MNREQIAKKRVKSAEEELKRAKAALSVLMGEEVTYSVGDRFKHQSDSKWLLVYNRSERVAMVSLKGGMVYKNEVEVSDIHNITPEEFNEIIGITGTNQWFTRYWDNAKKEYTDGRK